MGHLEHKETGAYLFVFCLLLFFETPASHVFWVYVVFFPTAMFFGIGTGQVWTHLDCCIEDVWFFIIIIIS